MKMTKTCNADGCDRKIHAKGLWGTCWRRQYRKTAEGYLKDKIAREKYDKSERGQQKRREYKKSERHKEDNKKRMQTEKWKEYHRKFDRKRYKEDSKRNAECKIRAILRKKRIKQSIPKWQNEEEIKLFWKNTPKGHHVDHIIPLKGELISGLTVIENLQYLPAKENLRKHNKWTPQINE